MCKIYNPLNPLVHGSDRCLVGAHFFAKQCARLGSVRAGSEPSVSVREACARASVLCSALGAIGVFSVPSTYFCLTLLSRSLSCARPICARSSFAAGGCGLIAHKSGRGFSRMWRRIKGLNLFLLCSFAGWLIGWFDLSFPLVQECEINDRAALRCQTCKMCIALLAEN